MRERLKSSKKGCKHVKFERTSQYPTMEEVLHKEYRNLQQKGIKVKAGGLE